MVELWNRFWTDESGQDLAEYALLLVFIALVVVAGLTTLGPVIRDKFTDIATELNNPPS